MRGIAAFLSLLSTNISILEFLALEDLTNTSLKTLLTMLRRLILINISVKTVAVTVSRSIGRTEEGEILL